MRFARIAVLGLALIAGLFAAFLASGSKSPPPKTVVQQAMPTAEVLVASKDIALGATIAAADLAWKTWPKQGSENYITKAAAPNALAEYTGAIARQPFVAGEPIQTQKIVKANGSGFMAAILPAGMRAVATEISAETGAGGFILPNDHVDVLLTKRAHQGSQNFTTDTILTNVRVLAIDQTIQEKNGEKDVVGRTATLELAPRQTETLALARQQGTISLALRSLADARPRDPNDADPPPARGPNTLTVVRFGVPTSTSRP
jgi:pilus assembly protein CpaB